MSSRYFDTVACIMITWRLKNLCVVNVIKTKFGSVYPCFSTSTECTGTTDERFKCTTHFITLETHSRNHWILCIRLAQPFCDWIFIYLNFTPSMTFRQDDLWAAWFNSIECWANGFTRLCKFSSRPLLVKMLEIASEYPVLAHWR